MGDFLNFVNSEKLIIFEQMLHPIRYLIIFYPFWMIIESYNYKKYRLLWDLWVRAQPQEKSGFLYKRELEILFQFSGLVGIVVLLTLNYDEMSHDVKNFFITLSEKIERNRKLRVYEER